MAEGQSPERNRRGPAVAANEGPKSAKPILAPPSPPLLIPDWRRLQRSDLNWRRGGLFRRFRALHVTPPPAPQLGFQRTCSKHPKGIPEWRRFPQRSRAAQIRRASNCHRERAAKPGAERSELRSLNSLADCRMLMAVAYFQRPPSRTHYRPEVNNRIYHLFAFLSRKNGGKTALI
jgi:hypothetical protein